MPLTSTYVLSGVIRDFPLPRLHPHGGAHVRHGRERTWPRTGAVGAVRLTVGFPPKSAICDFAPGEPVDRFRLRQIPVPALNTAKNYACG